MPLDLVYEQAAVAFADLPFSDILIVCGS